MEFANKYEFVNGARFAVRDEFVILTVELVNKGGLANKCGFG